MLFECLKKCFILICFKINDQFNESKTITKQQKIQQMRQNAKCVSFLGRHESISQKKDGVDKEGKGDRENEIRDTIFFRLFFHC